MGLLKTGAMLGGALLVGSAIGSGNGSALSEFAGNVFRCLAELLTAIMGGETVLADRSSSVSVSVDEAGSDTARRAMQAADMSAAEAVESIGDRALDSSEAEVAKAQYEAVHADAEAEILKNGTPGARIPGLGEAVGLKSWENEKDVAQLLHKEVGLGGFRVRDAQGNILPAKESVDSLFREIASRGRKAESSEELGNMTSEELKQMLKSGKGIISTDAQVHGSKISVGLKAGIDEVGLDPFKSESNKNISAYANAICDEYDLTEEERQELLPDIKAAVKRGIHDCEWDTQKPSGETKEDNAVYHVINRIEEAGLFSRLPEADVLQEYDSGRLAGARRSLADRRVSAALSKESDKAQKSDMEFSAEELLALSRNAEYGRTSWSVKKSRTDDDLDR